MSDSLFSASWYRVAALKPCLRSHAQIHRHHYRGQLWYVLQDHASQRYHRFSPEAYALLALMDGQHTVQDIWQQASARLGDDAPTQNDVIQILTQLHTADVLQCDVPPHTLELWQRHERQRRQRWQRQLLSPLFFRVSLFDPDRSLERFLPWVGPLFTWGGALLWLVVVGMAGILAIIHWHDLTHNFMDRVLAPQNMALLWLLFPPVKIVHEFGHGFATKVYGGEVHDMGVMILALQPVPYVDASAASALCSKWQRLVIGAAGMMVELFVASIALLVWLNVEPGMARAVAYNIMLIAGVSTVLFNANPLLRYDGYYIFGDFLEIPNLRARSHAYVGYLWERYVFGRREAVAEVTTRSERVWFGFYAVASCVYRTLVLLAISWFIAGKFFFIGVVLALGGMVTWLLVPTVRLLAYLVASPRLRQVRLRAIAVSVCLVTGLAGLVGWLPVSMRTRAQGVVWIPERAYVRAGTNGFIERLVAQPGTYVRRGDVLMICRDAILTAAANTLAFRLQELQTRYTVQWLKEPARAQLLKDEITQVEERLGRVGERVAELVIRSPADGMFVITQTRELEGQFVEQGALLGYVLDFHTPTVRVVVSQAQIDLVRQRTAGIEVRLAEHLAKPLSAQIVRQVPAATDHLPSMALGRPGGGAIAVDPSDTQGVKAVEKLFQFDLALPPSTGITKMGSRVYVRFDHGSMPLAQRWYRQLRRLFLSKFYM